MRNSAVYRGPLAVDCCTQYTSGYITYGTTQYTYSTRLQEQDVVRLVWCVSEAEARWGGGGGAAWRRRRRRRLNGGGGSGGGLAEEAVRRRAEEEAALRREPGAVSGGH